MTFIKTMQTVVTAEKSDSGSSYSKLLNFFTPASGMNKRTQNSTGFDSRSKATSTMLCSMATSAMYNYWKHLKADRSMHCHALSLDYLYFLRTSMLSLCTDCRAHVIECCFWALLFLFGACRTIVTLKKLYSRWATHPLFVF